MLRALLIGSSYAGLHVEPSVDSVCSWLLGRGFAAHEIERLTGPRATRGNILSRLDQLAASDHGDAAVVVYYAGHGQLYRSELGVEGGGHATYPLLVAVDIERSAPGSFRGILGSELTRALQQIARRSRNLTVILDCCHASGMVHLDDDTDCDPVRAREARLHEEASARIARRRTTLTRGSERAPPLSDRVVVVAASSAGGRAYPHPETERMVFTDALLAALDEHSTWDEVLVDARARVQAVWPVQHPYVFGPRFRRPFTLEEHLPQQELYRVELRRGELVLRQGLLGGIHPRDRFELLATAVGDATPVLAEARPLRVHADHTILRRAPSVALPAACYARRIGRGDPRAVDIVGATDDLRSNLLEVIHHAGLGVAAERDGGEPAARLTVRDGELLAHDRLGDLVYRGPAEPPDAEGLRRCLVRLDRWYSLTRWLDRTHELRRFRGCFELLLRREDELGPPAPGPIVVRPGDALNLELRNLDGGVAELYAQAYRVRADREIEPWNPGTGPQSVSAHQRAQAGDVLPGGARAHVLDTPPALPPGTYREWTVITVSNEPFDADLLATPRFEGGFKALTTRGDAHRMFEAVAIPYTLELSPEARR